MWLKRALLVFRNDLYDLLVPEVEICEFIPFIINHFFSHFLNLTVIFSLTNVQEKTSHIYEFYSLKFPVIFPLTNLLL